MSGINQILSIAQKALLAQQAAMNVVGSNISNAQNPQYSRQLISFSDDGTLRSGRYFLGSGAHVDSVQRARDQIYDIKIWQEKATFGQLESGQKYSQMTEAVFADFSGSGLSRILDDFWNGWNELANHPENLGARAGLRGKAKQLTNRLNNMSVELQQLSAHAAEELKEEINKVNQLTKEIARLNEHIQKNRTTSGLDNSALDQRDALIDSLSMYVDVTAKFHDNGSVTLYGGNHVLVDRAAAFNFGMTSENVDGYQEISLTLYGSRKVKLNDGSLKSLTDWSNSNTADKAKRLDEIAKALVEQVNSVHNNLYTLSGAQGIDFFSPNGTTAGSIQLANPILTDLANIAISKNGQSGDGAGAIDIANIRDARVLNQGINSIDDAYRTLVSLVGQQGNEILTKMQSQTDVISMLEAQRQSVMGVSLDEEMINMIQFQQAFEAASRLFVTADEMMQTIIDMVR